MNAEAGAFDRLPPNDLVAEQCAIASAIIDAAAFIEVKTIVGRDDLYCEDHRVIWDALSRMSDAGRPIDVTTLRAELKAIDKLDEVGGSAYIGTLLAMVPSAAHGGHYARIVKDKSLLRQLISVGNDAIRAGYAPHEIGAASDVIVSTITSMGRIIASSNSTKITPIDEVAQKVFASLEQTEVGLEQTGFGDLDAKIGGIARGEEVIIAARPSMGKSTLARGIAWRRAKAGFATGIISLEESKEKIARNIMSAEGSIENQKIRRKQLTRDDWTTLGDVLVKMNDQPLYIADKAFKLNTIKAVAAEMVSRFKVGMIILDYLQRVQVEGRDRFAKVTEASLGICEMIKDLDVAGVVLAQLNRGVEGRENKRPGMADLRESGQIEQDADGIIFIHREDYYHIDDDGYEPTRDVELIVAKMRDGVRGDTIKLQSSLNFQRFDDYTPEMF